MLRVLTSIGVQVAHQPVASHMHHHAQNTLTKGFNQSTFSIPRGDFFSTGRMRRQNAIGERAP